MNLLFGLLIFALSAIHFIAVLGKAVVGMLKDNPSADGFNYDFRFYALLMLGIILMIPAYRLITASRGLTMQLPLAWKQSIQASFILLAVNLPLAPIQGFAVAFVIFIVLNLTVLLAGKKRYRPQTS